jgi:YgiT-type zinc finger domain-containing protein
MFCKKCKEETKKTTLDRYEHEKGIVLENVEAYECPKCGEFIFTEKQLEDSERRTEVIKIHKFSFKRKLTVSGRALVINIPVNIPEDVVRHMKLTKGMPIKLTPLDDKRFLAEVGQ